MTNAAGHRLFLIFLLLNAPLLAQSPKIVLDASEWVFGEVSEGTKLEHTIEVRNDGDATLLIRRLEVTCGCLDAQMDQKTLAPGDTAELRLSLDSNNRRGSLIKQVRLHSNDPTMMTLELKVAGEIKSAWWPTRASLNLGDLKPGQRVDREVEVVVATEDELELVTPVLEIDADEIEVESRPFGEAPGRRGYRVRISFVVRKKEGELRAALVLRMPAAKAKEKIVAMRGRVLGTIVLRPERVGLGRMKPGQTKTIDVVLESRDHKRRRIIALESKDDAVWGELLTKDEAPVLRFRIHCTPADAKRMRLSGTLIIHTDDPDHPRVELPYSGVVLP